ncbi:hypothetical protein [Chryseobacterium indoltheticum]|uniref:hypothetical protein n=1 Tax=Chryseobacterium indoltheticum TaxID=254 RepID=UPI0028E328B0|nr:hypothetical protein [Chryseobacterium indoltheticum]
MAQPRNNNRNVNWLRIFQFMDSKYGNISLIVGIITTGYTFGYFSATQLKERELLQKEREYNNLSTEFSTVKIQFERERSDKHLEINQLKLNFNNLRDSINHAKK